MNPMISVYLYSSLYRTMPPNPNSRPAGDKARKKAKLGRILDQVYHELQTKKCKKKYNLITPLAIIIVVPFTRYLLYIASDSEKPLRLLERVEKPIPRPPTPVIDSPSEVRHLPTQLYHMYMLEIIHVTYYFYLYCRKAHNHARNYFHQITIIGGRRRRISNYFTSEDNQRKSNTKQGKIQIQPVNINQSLTFYPIINCSFLYSCCS